MSNDATTAYQGDIYFDTLRQRIEKTRIDRKWVDEAIAMGFTPFDSTHDQEYPSKYLGRLFHVTLSFKIYHLAEFEKVVEINEHNKQVLKNLMIAVQARHGTIKAIGMDLLTFLVLYDRRDQVSDEFIRDSLGFNTEIMDSLREILGAGMVKA